MDMIDFGSYRLPVKMLPRTDYREFSGSFYRRPSFSADYTFNDYIGEKRKLETSLRHLLSANWMMKDDFEVTADENIAFTICGAIYTPRIICREYIEILFQVIRSSRMRDMWCHATTLELEELFHGANDCDFRLYKNTLFVCEEESNFDFLKYFSRSRIDAARDEEPRPGS